MPQRAKRKSKSGPKPETLQIEGDWKKAVKGALKKKRPEKGWPKLEQKN
jgi:hypothetical protein